MNKKFLLRLSVASALALLGSTVIPSGIVGPAAASSHTSIALYLSAPLAQGSSATGTLGTDLFKENFNAVTTGNCATPLTTGVGTITSTLSTDCYVSEAQTYGGATLDTSEPGFGGAGSRFMATIFEGSGAGIRPEKAITIEFASPVRYIGLWWSAGNAGNEVQFLSETDVVLASYQSSEMDTLLGTSPTNAAPVTSIGGAPYPKGYYFGNPRGHASVEPSIVSTVEPNFIFAYLNLYISGTTDVKKVRFLGNGFEFDNVVASTIQQNPQLSMVLAKNVLGTPPVPQVVTWSPTNTATDTSATPLTPSVPATTSGDGNITYAVQSAGTTSCTVDPTTGVLSFTAVGTCIVRATAAGSSAYFEGYKDVTFTINAQTGTVTYTGTNVVPAGSKINLTASTTFTGACATALLYTYQYWDGDSWENFAAEGARIQTPNGSLAAGVYNVRVVYNESNTNLDCGDAISLEAVLTVYAIGSNAYGGGFYTIPSLGKSNFGFVVQKVAKTTNTFKGQVVWNFKENWRFKGTLNNFGKNVDGSVGSASGTGTLQYWNPDLVSTGVGGWVDAETNVNVIIKFTATTASTKRSTGSLGSFVINFGYTTPSEWAFAPLPTVNTLTILKGGNIKYS